MEKLLEILKSVRADVDFANEERLGDDGIIDSFDVVSIVGELCDAYDVVIGIDDMPLAPYTDTSLSSIRTFREEACQAAVDLLMKKIDNQYYTSHQEILIATELILRESVGRCPGSPDVQVQK